MLVVTVKRGESVILTDEKTGERTVVMLCSADRDKAKIGIEAPDHVEILRESLTIGREDRCG
jgi:carbon storage regulator CsrA